MSGAEWIFWSCMAAVLYHYAGYPVLLFIVSAIVQAGRDIRFLLSRNSRRARAAGDLPSVAIVFAAFNEQEVIADKLRNTASLRYPPDKLEVLLGLDAPTDASAERARSVAMRGLRIFEFSVRRGKFEVLCDLVQQTSADILVFTDANTILDPECVSKLVRHFSDPQVGAVSGEEVRFGAEGCSGELLYWRYESAIKILESRVNCLLGANGSVNAIRRTLFKPKAAYLMEDLQISLAIRFGGHRVVYDPEAIAMEDTVAGVKGQFERRVRIAAGVYSSLVPKSGIPESAPRRAGICLFLPSRAAHAGAVLAHGGFRRECPAGRAAVLCRDSGVPVPLLLDGGNWISAAARREDSSFVRDALAILSYEHRLYLWPRALFDGPTGAHLEGYPPPKLSG